MKHLVYLLLGWKIDFELPYGKAGRLERLKKADSKMISNVGITPRHV